MTDDTLREECEKLAYELYATSALHTYIERLRAFARAQQARGLREAAERYRDWVGGKWFDAMEFQDALEAQATAREAGKLV